MNLNPAECLLSHLESLGWHGRLVAASHLRELEEEILGNHGRGLFQEEFYAERLAWFSFQPPAELAAPESLICVAVPAPAGRIVFHWKGLAVSLTVPPTYAGYRRTIEQVHDRLAAFLGLQGYGVVHSQLPFKLLAVRSGLVEYGRNNIVYHRGMGSFLQLCAYYSDIPCGEDSWQEARMMERCRSCTACIRNCPTGAIRRDRFLLSAERCITYYNENANPLPDWLGSRWHDNLIGCMLCQKMCPENRHAGAGFVDLVDFSDEETEQLLHADGEESLSAATRAKLSALALTESLNVLMRNLTVILQDAGT